MHTIQPSWRQPSSYPFYIHAASLTDKSRLGQTGRVRSPQPFSKASLLNTAHLGLHCNRRLQRGDYMDNLAEVKAEKIHQVC